MLQWSIVYVKVNLERLPFKTARCFTFSGRNLDSRSVMIFPAVLNTQSEHILLGGQYKDSKANLAIWLLYFSSPAGGYKFKFWDPKAKLQKGGIVNFRSPAVEGPFINFLVQGSLWLYLYRWMNIPFRKRKLNYWINEAGIYVFSLPLALPCFDSSSFLYQVELHQSPSPSSSSILHTL